MDDATKRDRGSEGSPPRPDERALVAGLRAGDEGALAELVDRLHTPMLRFARAMVGPGRADDVVQEAWLAFLGGLERYEGRSSLKTWLYGIVANKAKALAAREGRLLPRSWDDEAGAGEGPSLPRSRFTFLGTWAEPPAPWARGDGPEGALLRGELRRELARQLETLPEGQRLVVLLRDVEGYTSEEVRDLLGIGDVNQRVLLHRGRSKLRGALEAYVRGHALPPTRPSGPPFPLFTTAASAMPITCPSLIELATDYREGALPGWQRTRISLHLLRCRHCRSYVRQLDETSELLRELDDPPAPAGAERAALLERLRPAKASGR